MYVYLPTFRRNLLPHFHFYPENGSCMFLWNSISHLPDCTVLWARETIFIAISSTLIGNACHDDYKALVGNPEERRPLWRPRHRCKGNITFWEELIAYFPLTRNRPYGKWTNSEGRRHGHRQQGDFITLLTKIKGGCTATESTVISYAWESKGDIQKVDRHWWIHRQTARWLYNIATHGQEMAP
jgi:hypothetical protein